MNQTLRLGTRGSLLAVAQSSWVANLVEQKNPGIKVELVKIVTKGDQILDVPLSKIEGKEFFVKEIDESLLSAQVDFTVHSFKDLSTERPSGIFLAAVPKREDPRDVIIFRNDVVEKIKKSESIVIGTSAPRRRENIPPFLSKALPRLSGCDPRLEFVEIRGNVNTRLLHLDNDAAQDGKQKRLDGVVLALAGLERLMAHESSRAEISTLLHHRRFMVLPLVESPAAPAQGALAVECRSDDQTTRACLAKIDDFQTRQNVAQERGQMAVWGGGCHQRFGISVVAHEELGRIFFAKGQLMSGERVDVLDWKRPDHQISTTEFEEIWDGTKLKAKATELETDLPTAPAYFVASSAAVKEKDHRILRDARVWASGTSSWFKLSNAGIWVEGCSEGVGFSFIKSTLEKQALALPKFSEWCVLTHKDAASGWGDAKVVSPYIVKYVISDIEKSQIKKAKYIFWSSGAQFELLGHLASKECWHSCGAGKTAHRLRAAGVAKLEVFPGVKEWRKCLMSSSNEQ